MTPDFSSVICSCICPSPKVASSTRAPDDIPVCAWCDKLIIQAPSRSYAPFCTYFVAWILLTVSSVFYVHQRDGAGWPVAIWTAQMILLGFVQIPAAVYLGARLEKRKQFGKPFSRFREGVVTFLVVVMYFATAVELFAIVREIFAPNNQPLFEAARLGFVQGLIMEAAFLGAVSALASLTLFFWALFMMVAHIAIDVSSGLKYPTSCNSCKKHLALLLPHYPKELLDPEIPLPSYITKDHIRKCTHCEALVLPTPYSIPRKVANNLGWGVITFFVTMAVGLRDGWGWPTIVLALEVALVPFGFVPFILKGYLWLYAAPNNGNFNDLPTWRKLVLLSLWIGMPLGTPLAVILCMRYDWKIPVHFARQLGLIIGPLCIACCVFVGLAIFKASALIVSIFKPVAQTPSKV